MPVSALDLTWGVWSGAVAPVAPWLPGNDIPPCPASPEACVALAGPFISVVLSKLENMLENSLHVNLLLIGIITQLASYPQPLLRSFLLNTNMVFQPSVRSLYQVRLLSPHPHLLTLWVLMSGAPPPCYCVVF